MKTFQITFRGIPQCMLADAHKHVQTKLFELGYGWAGTEKKVQYDYATCLQMNYFSHDWCITFDATSFVWQPENNPVVFNALSDWDKWIDFASKAKPQAQPMQLSEAKALTGSLLRSPTYVAPGMVLDVDNYGISTIDNGVVVYLSYQQLFREGYEYKTQGSLEWKPFSVLE